MPHPFSLSSTQLKMELPPIKHISSCYIKPKYEVENSKQPYHLSPWDLMLLAGHYNQKGLLFSKPNHRQNPDFSIHNLLDTLKDSLSLTLVHFYPLAGQFVTKVDPDHHRSTIFVDCNKGPGARFLYATLNATVSDIIPSDGHVPPVVKSFFEYSNGEANHDGHSLPLLSVQVTELVDGVFIGCSMSHVIVDGTSFWHFWNVWSKIHRDKGDSMVIDKPIHTRWVPDGYQIDDIFLPYTHSDEFITRFVPPENLKERFFRFSSKTIARLKAQANQEIQANSNWENCHKPTPTISSFQALIALVWKAIIKAQGLPHDQPTHCKMAANNRPRINPPLPREYFGNSLGLAQATTTVGHLLDRGLGWAAWLLNQAVAKQSEEYVLDFFSNWFKAPVVYQLGSAFVPGTVQVGSSPRFNVYGNKFDGLGEPAAVRSGRANKYAGKVTVYPGPCQDVGSVDIEICLLPHNMRILEDDEEFMSSVFTHLS